MCAYPRRSALLETARVSRSFAPFSVQLCALAHEYRARDESCRYYSKCYASLVFLQYRLPFGGLAMHLYVSRRVVPPWLTPLVTIHIFLSRIGSWVLRFQHVFRSSA